eukprot:TRINITY_DN14171_c0_g1_i1.p1 TRINITY_DN14171_c0_g1~~TRINITY_DN14171_c0_g1_i1.p1  ORF type:complete len:426 (+),score=147.27 TRINITY_DN14171_c0_g1_i1:68-1345(+)
MNRYRMGACVGQGYYGTVHRAVFTATDKEVAIKVLQGAKNSPMVHGLPVAAYREMRALQRLQPHPNIIALHEVFPHGSHLCFVFDLLHTDLGAVITGHPGRHPMGEATIKSILLMILRGVAHAHENGIIHRDMKPSNIFLTCDGVVQLGDFGSSRSFRDSSAINHDMTHEVGTKWYRAPELLLGLRSYGTGVDLWSVGCVLGEMYAGNPVFPGTTEIDQIVKIFRALGSPDDESWPERTACPDWTKLQVTQYPTRSLAELLPTASPTAVALLSTMLCYDGRRRVSAEEALAHPFFYTDPQPLRPCDIWLAEGARKAPLAWDDVLTVGAAPPPEVPALYWHPAAPVMQPASPTATSLESPSSSSATTSTQPGGAPCIEEEGEDDPTEAGADGSDEDEAADGCADDDGTTPIAPRPPSVERIAPSGR